MNRDPFGLGLLLYGAQPSALTAAAWVVGPLAEREFDLAHEGCSLTTFCRNPLHPGPCKGWKKKLGVEAPGALKAITKAAQEKHAAKIATPEYKAAQAAKKAAHAEAKSAGAKRAAGIASPLHAKKAATLHANVLLGNDETKAGAKADKVILSKPEIKKYSKIKAAHINSIRAKHGQQEDPGLEERLAEAFAEDNKSGKDDAYRAALRGSAESLGAQLAKDHCHKGNHKECDDEVAFGQLRNHLADLAEHALLTGDDEQLDKALADFDAGKLDIPKPAAPKEPKAQIPASTKAKALQAEPKMTDEQKAEASKALADAWGSPAPAKKVSHATKKAAAKKAPAKKAATTPPELDPAETGGAPFNVAKAEQLFNPAADWGTSKSQKLALLDDMTPEEYNQLSPKTKAAVDKLITETAAGSAPAMGDIAKKIQVKLGIGGKGGPVGKAIDHGLTDEEAVSLSLGTSQEQWDGLTPAQKAKLLNQIEGANEYDNHHGEDSGANEALNHLAKLDAAKTPTDATAPEPDILQELMDAVPMATDASHALGISPEQWKKMDNADKNKLYTKIVNQAKAGDPEAAKALDHLKSLDKPYAPSAQVKLTKEALDAEGVPQWQLKQQAEKLGPDDWKHFTPHEQQILKDALASAPPKPYDPYATPPGHITMPDGTHADLHAMFGPDGDPDHKDVVDAVTAMSQDDYDSLTHDEKSMLALHVHDASSLDEPGSDNAQAKLASFVLNAGGDGVANPSAVVPGVLTPEAKAAKDVAHGVKSMIAKKKLETYEKVTGPEFQALDADTQKLILADLLAIKDKFSDPKKKGYAQQHHDYLSGFMGGGAGAGGAGPAASTSTGDANLDQALKDLHGLATLTKAPGSTPVAPEKEMQEAFKDFVDASGHEKAAKAFAGVWADNALKALDDMHADPLGTGAYEPDALALAKPALAAEIQKKLLGQPGPTPLLDKLKQAKAYGDPMAADDFMAEAIKTGNPSLPGPDVHKMKAQAITSLWSAAAPGWKKPTPNDTEAAVSMAGALGYNSPSYDAFTTSEGQKIAAGVMGGGFDQLGLGIDDKVELLQPEGAHTVLAAITAEMQQAVKDGASAHPKGGYVEQFHDAVKTADQAGNDLASKNGWAVDSPVVQEYKKTIMSTKLDEMADKIKNNTPAVHSTGGAGAGGTGSSGHSVAVGSGTKSGFTNAQNQVITGTLKSQGINLSSSAPQVWDVAVAAAAAHQGKDGFPTSMTVLDVLNATDEGHAKNLGVTNSNLLRKKVVDWLGTPAGKKYAEDNSTPKPTIMGKLTGDLSIKLPPGQKVQTLSGPGPYDPNHNGPWKEKDVQAAFADQKAAWDAMPDVPWNTNPHGYHKPGWKTKWTDDEQDGLYSYTLGSGTINDYLRGETKTGMPVHTASHATKQTIINIQSAMQPLKEDHLFKRGTGWEQFPKGFRSPEDVKKLIGKNVTEKAFLSTSVPGGGSSGFGGPVRMEIEAPAGTHAAFVEGLSAFKGGVEQEMLLAAGQVMRVLSVKQEGHQTVVRVRIVTPK